MEANHRYSTGIVITDSSDVKIMGGSISGMHRGVDVSRSSEVDISELRITIDPANEGPVEEDPSDDL